jgi:hypothetical protein
MLIRIFTNLNPASKKKEWRSKSRLSKTESLTASKKEKVKRQK